MDRSRRRESHSRLRPIHKNKTQSCDSFGPHMGVWRSHESPRGSSRSKARPFAGSLILALSLTVSLTPLLAACGSGGAGGYGSAADGKIVAVGAENEYANVIAQIGGAYVKVSAIESNPNTDPHSFEASPSVAETVAAAKLIVQNGAGYDTFMDKIESASEGQSRRVIDVQKLLGLPESTANPHLWYKPATMPALAGALVSALTDLQPAHAAYFRANAVRFDESLQPWLREIARLETRYPGAPVATTEPVGDYML